MSVLIALLRGVNVGGASVVAMAQVRAVAESCGFTAVRSYVQSGNLVFAVESAVAPDDAAGLLRDALAAQTAVAPAVMVRTQAELRAVVEANPWAGLLADGTAEPTHVHALFLAAPFEADSLPFDPADFAPEELHLAGRELYLYLPGGAGRSKLAVAVGKLRGLDRKPLVATMRNWRTVSKLLEMAEDTPGR